MVAAASFLGIDDLHFVRADGLAVSHIHIRHIWPLPKNLGDLLGSFIGGHIDLDGLDVDYKHTGSLTGFTLAGPVVITDEAPDGVRELVGTYSAVRR